MAFTRKNLKRDLDFGAPNLGDDPRGDVEGTRDWWTD